MSLPFLFEASLVFLSRQALQHRVLFVLVFNHWNFSVNDESGFHEMRIRHQHWHFNDFCIYNHWADTDVA